MVFFCAYGSLPDAAIWWCLRTGGGGIVTRNCYKNEGVCHAAHIVHNHSFCNIRTSIQFTTQQQRWKATCKGSAKEQSSTLLHESYEFRKTWWPCAFQAVSCPKWQFCINSLTAIGGPDRQLFFKLRARVVSPRIFVRLQSLIARWTRNDFSLPAVSRDFYKVLLIDDVTRGSKSYLFCAS